MLTKESPTLPERRARLATELDELHKARGAALLDGQPFDAERLRECRSELAAIDAAEAEAVRRDRAAGAAREAQERAETRGALGKSLDRYMAALGRAESAAKAMVADLKQAEDLAGVMRGQVRIVGGGLPVSLDPMTVRAKHSTMLATMLRQITGGHHFGALKWRSVEPIPDWPAYARKSVAVPIQPLIEGN